MLTGLPDLSRFNVQTGQPAINATPGINADGISVRQG